MKKKNKLVETRQSIIVKTLILAGLMLILVVFLKINDKLGVNLGIIFGVGISILNFIELEKTLINSTRMNPSRAQSYATKKYFLRYIVVAVTLFVSLQASYINVVGTIIGLLLLKFVIMFTNLFNDKEYFIRIFREEG